MTIRNNEIRRDFYIPNNLDHVKYKPDGTVLFKEDFLKYAKNVRFDAVRQKLPPERSEWYPLVNSYYPCGSNADPVERVNYLLDTKSSTSFNSCNDQNKFPGFPYAEKAAQKVYLESNPVSFIIVGKQHMGQEQLGKQLAAYWQCEYIEPQTLVAEEIESGSRAGKSIEFNLRLGRSIGIDVILRLVEKRVNSESSKHRGFVLCGLPLVANNMYEEEKLVTESAIFTAKETLEEVISTTLDIGVPPVTEEEIKGDDIEVKAETTDTNPPPQTTETDLQEEIQQEQSQIPEEPQLPTDYGEERDVCHAPEISTDYESQLSFLFNLLKPPFFIIYLICSPRDCILRRKNAMFDIYSQKNVDLVTENTNKMLYNYFARRPEILLEVPKDCFETYFYNVELESIGLRHLVLLPSDFPAAVEAELDVFYMTAVDCLERRIMIHDPEYFLKVDARTSVRRMMHIIKARLNILPLQTVVIPERIHLTPTLPTMDQPIQTEAANPQQEFLDTNNIDEYFDQMRKLGTPSETFKWTWSDWKSKCPVSLSDGCLVTGDPNIAVHFMNKIFFLADEEACLKFCRNPRPYLMEPNPKPAGKIFICGPMLSGRTCVAKCLGYLLDAKVLSLGAIQLDFIVEKEKEFYDQIRVQATAKGISLLNKNRKEESDRLEAIRVDQIKQWATKVRDLIDKLEVLFLEREKELQGETKFELSSFPMAMAKVEVTDLETEVTIAIGNTRSQLEQLNIPSFDTIDEYKFIKSSKVKFFTYTPAALRKKHTPKPALETDTFVVNYVKKALAEAVFEGADLIEQNMFNLIINSIKDVEDEAVKQGKVRGGWIVDGMHIEPQVLKKVCAVYLPDEVIHLCDTEDFAFLKERFSTKGTTRFDNYTDFFMSMGKVDAAYRSEADTDDHLLDEVSTTEELIPEENFYAELSTFNAKWADAEEFLQSVGLNIIEIEITDKSLPKLLEDAIRAVEDKYRVSASPLTDKDRDEEIQAFAGTSVITESDVDDTTVVNTEGDVAQDERSAINDQIFRRYGDTYHYCPVILSNYWVLSKGKEEFAVKFQDRVYLLSNQNNYEKFLKAPRDYLTGKPPTAIPPPRICIVGVPSCGKTALAKVLALNYGLTYVSFEAFIKSEFHIDSDDTFESLKNLAHLDKHLRIYLLENNPLPLHIYKRISRFWFEEPTKTMGFVLDDFPKRPCDVEIMVDLNLIPDLIIDLKGDLLTLKNKAVEERLLLWEENISVYRIQKANEFRELVGQWEETRQKKFNEMLEKAREERYAEKRRLKEEELEKAKGQRRKTNEPKIEEVSSQVSFDSLADQQDVDETNRLLDLEMPRLVPEPMETEDEMRIKIEQIFTEHQEVELNFLPMLVNIFKMLEFPYVEMTVDEIDYERNIRQIYLFTESIKYRNISFLESCYDISFDLAERLLFCGYCFLSKFGKICPVEYKENKNPLISLPTVDYQFNIFPIIHRSYIYFVNSDNVEKFKENPLLYVNVDRVDYPLIPMKLAVTGPPKCGKTTLANRIADEYGMKAISRGQALRYVLYFLPFSNLAASIERVLRKGWTVTDEMVSKCVEAASLDARCVTRGVVYDGFPSTIVEVTQMSYFGLIPHLVIDLEASKDEMLECYSFDVGHRGFQKYSVHFIEHLREEWEENMNQFDPWFEKEYQVMYKISIDPSLWSIWHKAKEIIKAVTFEIKHYYVYCHSDWPMRLSYMQVSPLEYLERKSVYDSFCPCCLLLRNILTTGGSPPDRTGLVQWRRYFYWICNDHMNLFLKTPDAYLLPYGCSPPEHLPKVLDLRTSRPKNLFEEGFCAACYKNDSVMTKGVSKHAIYYKDKTYLFCSSECSKQFLQRPHSYCFEINFRPPKNYPCLARRVPVPDERFDYLCEYFKPLSKVPAFLNVVDIAGLVKGASEGQGLGNAFLSHISACDAIFHLCRAFEDDDVTHVEGEVNPVRDLDIICEELRLKDEDTLTKNLEKLERTVGRGNDKKLKPEFDTLTKIKQVLVEEKKHIRFADWDTKDIEILNKYLFLTSKPAIYLVNLSEKDYIKRKNKWLVKIKEWVDKNDPGSYIIPFSGAFEQKLLEEFEDPVLRKKYLEDNSTSSALDKIIVQGYKTLQLEYFFTAGADEVKAWTIQKGTKAPQAAGRIHTDFEKGFIMAEVMKFVDFKEEGSEAACKGAGKYRQQGRNYVVDDGDIIFFKFNAGAGLQAAAKKK